jgi:hypothetical protein
VRNYYRKERIGKPELFTGRTKELTTLLKWVEGIKGESSKSTALLSRRKTGKTAIIERLYNIVFHNNDTVVPFYFEIEEKDQWLLSFSIDFFLSFIYQYLAFKTRKSEYISYPVKTFNHVIKIAENEKFNYIADIVKSVHELSKKEEADSIWGIVINCPRLIAEHYNECILQMIDEFQYINRHIFHDKEKTRVIDNLAGSYHSTCEYKNAPLLISGSWIGWLMDDINKMLYGRCMYFFLDKMPQNDLIEMVFKYSYDRNIPVSEKTAYIIAEVSEGNPHYISAIMDSFYEKKDLLTEDGIKRTLEYEITKGVINTAWMEYIDAAFPRINDVYAKKIVLYLSKNRKRKIGRTELKEKLGIQLSDPELEKKLRTLYKADIIDSDGGMYRGVQDNVFDKVFRGLYSDDIDKFINQEAPGEYKKLFEHISEKYKKLSGDYSRLKGAWAEFMFANHLRLHASKNNSRYKSMINNLPDDFEFVEYKSVWSYHSSPMHDPQFQIDIFAESDHHYALIGEIKNRKAKFSIREAKDFQVKAMELIKIEKVKRYALFVFSRNGFHENAVDYLEKEGIAWTMDKNWLV